MTSALAVLLALVAVYCLARCVVPSWHPHGAAVEGWHVVMAAAMVAMLVLPVRREAALLQLLLFALGLGWCLAHLLASGPRGVHLRLGAGFVAMAVMLTPTAFAPASAAMPGMSHPSGAPGWLAAALVGGMLLVVAAALGALARSDRWPVRLGVGCEVVMAAGMAAMVVAM